VRECSVCTCYSGGGGLSVAGAKCVQKVEAAANSLS
jgi:hypothetical protein